MKNVLKRSIELLNLLSVNPSISTENIKDNILDYRDLSEQSFRRSFERDKNLLRSFGYMIDYQNDKWSFEKGYTLSGNSIFETINNDNDIDIHKFFYTYFYLKKYLSSGNMDSDKSEIIVKVIKSINEKRRVAFDYLKEYRKVKPKGLKYYNNKWYIAGDENGTVKTFNLNHVKNLKLGNKTDLFDIDVSSFPFSWESEKLLTEVVIEINNDIYEVNKNMFTHNVIKKKISGDNLNCKILTNDNLGLVKFFLLSDTKIKIIKINNTKEIERLLHE
ncbi:MAG: WYL domain-containing protein [Candidatus Actinomarina sp.]|tara:strand:- start:3222 stop:4046 length:825 start_codon:yes stop_codon:yes gene_type:complete